MTRDGLRKPAYFAFKYLNELGSEELENADSRSWACRSGKDVGVLMWDFRLPEMKTGDRVYFRQKHEAAALGPARVRVAGLAPGRYLMEEHRTGQQANDAYSAYLAMGMPKNLSAAALEKLTVAAADDAEAARVIDVGLDGVFGTSISMREDDVVFISLKKD
jgi:xylan 1,4-beta-xylosidase